ncbi:MAG TPA: hypothetical protein ENI77_06700 [Nitrospirae bacterium]|nr:hypothetical protein [Nitrospirota bacterium]
MVIERVTGGKPQEAPKARQNASGARRVDAGKGQPAGKSAPVAPEPSVMANVSEKSKAAIKAYRIASESKPDISRAQRVAQIKAKVANGTYKAPASHEVATAVIKDVVKGS